MTMASFTAERVRCAVNVVLWKTNVWLGQLHNRVDYKFYIFSYKDLPVKKHGFWVQRAFCKHRFLAHNHPSYKVKNLADCQRAL